MLGILDLIGNTPLVDFANVNLSPVRVLHKLEKFNAGGSIKDRPARFILDQAVREGRLRPGGTIIESSSGNFGISLAMIGAVKGYRVIIVIDPKITPMNRSLLTAYGAELVVVDRLDDTGTYQKTRLARVKELHQAIPGSFVPNQAFNLANSEAHYRHTGPELLQQTGGDIGTLVLSVGTAGTIGGVSQFLKERAPHIRIVAVDADGSGIFSRNTHPYALQGLGLGWTPRNLRDLRFIDAVYHVKDVDAFSTCRAVAKAEGHLLGASGGAVCFAALALALKGVDRGSIVTVIADSGERYLDTVYNDDWIVAKGLELIAPFPRLQERMLALEPLSEEPVQCANYRPDWDSELSPDEPEDRPVDTPVRLATPRSPLVAPGNVSYS
jgi:2,3-diaminopropionate biosynthesis protein SbnA